MSNERMDKEIEEAEAALNKALKAKEEKRMVKQIISTNHVGKLKKHKSMRKSAPPKKPLNFIKRNSTFTNYGAALGMTDEQYVNWKKTGQLPK